MLHLRVALRQLRKNPGFAAAIIGTLALGIGATAAMFSLVNAVLLRPLPFPEANRLTWVQRVDTSMGPNVPEAFNYPDFFEWRAQNHCFTSMASYRGTGMTLTGAGEPRQLGGQVVSAEFFRVLGVQPLVGRDFRPEEDKSGAHVVMLSHELWRSVFGGARDAAGSTIVLSGKTFTVAGVMPASFSFPIGNPPPAFWVTLTVDAEGAEPMTESRGNDSMDVVARLKPGVSREQAIAETSVIARNLSARYPEDKPYTASIVQPLLESVAGDTRPALRVLFAAVGLLLLIACANASGLLLARAGRQRAEIAVRVALGAGRTVIVRGVLVESLVLSLAAGALGAALAGAILKTTLRFLPANLPRAEQASLDPVVLAFVIVVSIATGLLFGVLPALRMSRVEPLGGLREGGRGGLGGARGQNRLQGALVIAETAVGLVLLIGSGLLIRSFVKVLRADPGFAPHQVLTASLNLPPQRYDRDRRMQFYRELLPSLAALPGVQAVAAGFPLPLGEGRIGISFEIEGRNVPKGEQPSEKMGVVTSGYFAALKIPVVAGREFTSRDDTKGAQVIVIDQAFARKYFPGENPIGKHMKPGLGDGVVNKPMREIVGVVGNVKIEGIIVPQAPHYFLPFEQAVITSPPIVIRTTTGDPLSLIGPLRAELARMDRDVPLYRVSTLDGLVYRAAAQPRFQTLLLSSFAALALLLAAVGLYGVLAYMVVQRTPEIGIRMAIGAQRIDVVRLILGRGMKLAAAGAALGIVGALFVTEFLQNLLYEVQPLDTATFGIVTLVLLGVSLLAGIAPALRAAHLDPMTTLRNS